MSNVITLCIDTHSATFHEQKHYNAPEFPFEDVSDLTNTWWSFFLKKNDYPPNFDYIAHTHVLYHKALQNEIQLKRDIWFQCKQNVVTNSLFVEMYYTTLKYTRTIIQYVLDNIDDSTISDDIRKSLTQTYLAMIFVCYHCDRVSKHSSDFKDVLDKNTHSDITYTLLGLFWYYNGCISKDPLQKSVMFFKSHQYFDNIQTKPHEIKQLYDTALNLKFDNIIQVYRNVPPHDVKNINFKKYIRHTLNLKHRKSRQELYVTLAMKDWKPDIEELCEYFGPVFSIFKRKHFPLHRLGETFDKTLQRSIDMMNTLVYSKNKTESW